MFYLRVAVSILGFVVASVYGVWIAVLRRDRSRVASDYAHALTRLMRPGLGLTTEVRGREHLLAHRPCIYIANHQSMFDVPVLAELYGPGMVVIGKKELRSIPFFGWLYAVTGQVFIDRKDNPKAVGRLREAEQAILERRVSVWIFPEGTRGREPGRLLPFKKGAFHMAVATGAPLVPVVVEPVERFFSVTLRRARPGRIRVRVLEPIVPAGHDPDELRALAQERMQAALDELAATASPTPPPRT